MKPSEMPKMRNKDQASIKSEEILKKSGFYSDSGGQENQGPPVVFSGTGPIIAIPIRVSKCDNTPHMNSVPGRRLYEPVGSEDLYNGGASRIIKFTPSKGRGAQMGARV